MENVWEALGQLIAARPLLLALFATVVGILWGAAPGLSAVMALALTVGLTYGMSTNDAVIFLLALYTSTIYGGSITAVLINIPGTPASICTAIEGYPLTKKGEGSLALGTALVSSFLGNWIGLISLIIFVPLILTIALKFGAWEQFLLAIWGISISGSLTTGKPIKGWLTGCLGLLISMVGMDPIYGFYRFTFGQIALYSGIELIPILVGLFGLAEALNVLSTPKAEMAAPQVKKIIPSFSLVKRNLINVFRSGAIGTLIGAIPGPGPDTASFLAYSMAKKWARGKEREEFGRGSYPGLIASEVANNAAIGGSILPVFTLGIPGSAGAAIVLAALNLHGIRVGPSIGLEHPGLIEFSILALIVANLLMYGVALLLIKPGVKLFTIRKELLLPTIVPLCAIAAYGVNQVRFDYYVAVAFGLVGFLFYRMKYPIAPLCLGVILGPMADENLRKAVLIFHTGGASIIDILSRPVGTILLIIVALTFYDGLFRKR